MSSECLPWRVPPLIPAFRTCLLAVLLCLQPVWADQLNEVQDLIRRGQTEQAVSQARQAAAIGRSASQIALLDALWKDGRVDEAIGLLRILEKKPPRVKIPYWQVRYFIIRGDIEDFLQHHPLALKNYKQAIRTAAKGSLSEFEARAAIAIYEEDESYLEGLEYTYDPDESPHQDQVLLNARARLAASKGQWTKCLHLWRSLERSYANTDNKYGQALAVFQRAVVYRKRRAPDLAKKAVLKAGKLFAQAESARGLSSIAEGKRPELPWADWLGRVQGGPYKVRLLLLLNWAAETSLEQNAWLNQAQVEAERLDIDRLRARVEYARSNQVWRDSQDREAAIAHTQRALDLIPKNGIRIPDYHWLWASDYFRLKQYLISYQPSYLSQSRDLNALYLELGDSHESVRNRLDISRTLASRGMKELDLDLAFQNFERGLRDLRRLYHKPSRFNSLSSLLDPLLRGDRFQGLEAPEFLTRRRHPLTQEVIWRLKNHPTLLGQIFEELDDYRTWCSKKKQPAKLAYALVIEAEFLEFLSRAEEAQRRAKEAESMAQASGAFYTRTRAQRLLAALAVDRGEIELAREYLQKGHQQNQGALLGDNFLDDRVWVELTDGEPKQALPALELLMKAQYYGRRAPLMSVQTLLRLKRYPEARSSLELLRSRVQPNEDRWNAIVLYWDARLCLLENQPRKAQSALRSLLGLPNLSNPLISRDANFLLGKTLEQLEQPEEALLVYRQEIERFLKFQSHLSSSRSRLDTAGEGVTEELFSRAMSLCFQLDRPADAAYFLEASQSIKFLESLDPKAKRKVLTLERLSSQVQRLKALKEQAKKEEEQVSIQRALATNQVEFQKTLNKLKAETPEYERVVGLQNGQAKKIQARLGANELAVQYYLGPNAVYLIALTNKSSKVVEVRVDKQRFVKRLTAFQQSLSSPQSQLSTIRSEGREIYRILLEPLQAQLKSKSHVRVLPTEQLWSLPFESLTDLERRWADEKWTFSYSNSSDILTQSMPASSQPNLVIGRKLSGAQAEVKLIARMFPKAAKMIGHQANIAGVKKALTQHSFIHLASHSRWQSRGRSEIELDDGDLSSSQVSALKIQDGTSVVLSSCQSGLTSANSGREATSLSSSFLAAGASRVIASRWKIDDQETSGYFTEVYTLVKGGQGLVEALRGARSKIRGQEKTAHPYYWSAFGIYGHP